MTKIYALKLSRSLYCFTTSISHDVENCFPRLWGMAISDAIFTLFVYLVFIRNDNDLLMNNI